MSRYVNKLHEGQREGGLYSAALGIFGSKFHSRCCIGRRQVRSASVEYHAHKRRGTFSASSTQQGSWHALVHCLQSHQVLFLPSIAFTVNRIFLVETLVRHCRQSQFRALKLADCSTLDDPVVLSGMLPWSFFWTESQHSGVRWSLCAREICYKSIFVR